MRIRFSLVLLALALPFAAWPVFASTARRPVTHQRHRRASLRRAAVTYHAGHGAKLPAQGTHAALTTGAPARHSTIPTLAPIHFVPPLRGSRASLLRQNVRDTAEGLVRIQDEAQLNAMERNRELVPVPTGVALRMNPDLPFNRRDCRPWTARFLSDFARVHYARFGRPLQVNSAVRTVSFQRALMEVNGNAAAADGDLASPHLTGAAIDIGKRGLSLSEIAWMRAWLLPLQTAGKIDVEEEFYQSCFHITVYRSYVPPAPVRPVPRRHSTTTLLAATIR